VDRTDQRWRAREPGPVCDHRAGPVPVKHALNPSGPRGSGGRPTLVAYLFLLPALALLAVFTFYPVVFGTVLGLFEYDVIEPPRDHAVRGDVRHAVERTRLVHGDLPVGPAGHPGRI